MYSFSEPLATYYRIIVTEFPREWRFLQDGLAGRAVARADFTDKMVGHLKTVAISGISQAPLPGTSIAGKMFSLSVDWVNAKRKEEKDEHIAKQDLEIDEVQLQILVRAAALEACRRHQFFIMTQLSEEPLKGVVPLAKTLVERMLEYIGRNQLPLSVENLVDAFVAGHSGAFARGYMNTRLAVREPKKASGAVQKVKRLVVGSGVTAEGMLGRSALMTRDGKLYALADKKKALHKMHKKKGQEALFDYGYVHFFK